MSSQSYLFFPKKKKKKRLCLCQVFSAACRLAPVVVAGGVGGWRLLFIAVQGLLIAVVSPVSSSRRMSFNTCDTQAQKLRLLGSRARTSLVAPRHVGPSWTRDWTCVPCIGRRLYHWATREAPRVTSYPPWSPGHIQLAFHISSQGKLLMAGGPVL